MFGAANYALASAKSVTLSGTGYTSSLSFQHTVGYASMLITSTAGSITVTQQCSMDNINWYDPVDKTGTALGVVTPAFTVTAGRYVQFDPVYSPYIRFKIVEGGTAATSVTIIFSNQEQI